MGKVLKILCGILMVYLGNGIAFGDSEAPLTGRLYSNNLQSIEFISEYTGRVVEDSTVVEFSFYQDENVIYFEGLHLRSEFLRGWLIKDGGSSLVSTDGRIKMSLETALPVSKTNHFAPVLIDLNKCPPSFCRSTKRCFYNVSNGICSVDHCHHTKSCE